MAAYALEAPFTTPLTYLSLFGLGALVMRGAGCTINDMWDRNLDKGVGRWLMAPSFAPSSHILCREDQDQASCCRAHHAHSGVRVPRAPVDRWPGRAHPAQLVQVRTSVSSKEIHRMTKNSILLGASSLSVVTIYPFMKRVTYWPQAVLGEPSRTLPLPTAYLCDMLYPCEQGLHSTGVLC